MPTLKPINITTYKTILTDLDKDGSDVDIIIGGSNPVKFIPNINASKWDDEAFLNINFQSITVNNETPIFLDNKIEITAGDITFISYPLSEKVLEIGIRLGKPILLTELRLLLVYSDGLKFCPQGELTAEQIKDGCIRPPNVVGSLAVYWKEKNNQYKTGKFCHMYRWECIDADGKKEWCDPLRVENDELVIGLPVAWLQTAKYPVTIMGAGDTLGYSTVGGTTGLGSHLLVYHAGGTTNADGGNVGNFHVAIGAISATHTVKMGIYDDSGNEPNNLLEQVEFSVAVSDDNFCASVDKDLLAGSTKYWVGAITDYLTTDYKADEYAGDPLRATDTTYAAEMADPATATGASDWAASIWVDYEAEGGGLSIPVAMHHYKQQWGS